MGVPLVANREGGVNVDWMIQPLVWSTGLGAGSSSLGLIHLRVPWYSCKLSVRPTRQRHQAAHGDGALLQISDCECEL